MTAFLRLKTALDRLEHRERTPSGAGCAACPEVLVRELWPLFWCASGRALGSLPLTRISFARASGDE